MSIAVPARWPALDGLRGAALILVILDHVGLTGGRPLGIVGVTVFFVLSGFLITTTLLRGRQEGRDGMRRFLVARVVRLSPALLLMILIVGVGWVAAGNPLHAYVEHALTAGLYLEDFFHAQHDQAILSHTWSLAVEEQFYLVWPLVLAWVVSSPRSRIFVLVGVAACSVLLRLWLARAGYVHFSYANLSTNVYALIAGGLTAILRDRLTPVARLVALPAVLLSILMVALGPHVPYATFTTPVVVAAGTVPLILVALRGVPALEAGYLTFTGRISYSLYLWHWPLLWLTGLLFAYQREPAAVIGVLALSIAISYLSTRYLEEPLRQRWRRRVDTAVPNRSRHSARPRPLAGTPALPVVGTHTSAEECQPATSKPAA